MMIVEEIEGSFYLWYIMILIDMEWRLLLEHMVLQMGYYQSVVGVDESVSSTVDESDLPSLADSEDLDGM
jgi:hypothetical protein